MSLEAASFIVFSLLMVGVGFVAIVRASGGQSADYLLAGRSSGAIGTALSGASSDTSGWVVMGLIGIAYTTGLGALWVIPAGWLGYVLNWWVVGERLRGRSRELGSETLPAFLSDAAPGRCAVLVQMVAALVLVVFLTFYMSGQTLASGKLLAAGLGIKLETGIWLGFALVVPYVVAVGYRGIVWSDIAQSILILTALLVVPVWAVVQAGGPGEVYSLLADIDPALASVTAGRSGWGAVVFVLFWLSIGLAYPGQPHLLARFMAARDTRSLEQGRVVAIIWFTIIVGMAVVTGVCARAAFSELPGLVISREPLEIDSERVLPILAGQLFVPVVSGMVLAAVLAACITTLNSQLFSVISTVLSDGSSLIRRPAPRLNMLSRVASVLFIGAIACLLAAWDERNVFDIVLDSWAILGAAFGPAVIYALWARGPRSPAILSGICVGTTVGIALTAVGGETRLVGSVAASAVAILIAHSVLLGVRDQTSGQGENTRASRK